MGGMEDMELNKDRYLKLCMILLVTFLLISLYTINAYALSVRLNDKGDRVQEIQSLLNKVGYDINVDGIFGYRTKEIVKDFQVNHSLTVDGIVGDTTYQKLTTMAEDIRYTVKKGDTLYDIARKYDTTVQSIKESNNIRGEIIHPGDVLYLPNTGRGGGEENRIYANIIHEVQPGDALYNIARKYGVDLDTIKGANNLKTDKIVIGQNLVIPFEQRINSGQFNLQKGAFIWPITGRITSYFGWRNDPIARSSDFHQGLDIAAPVGKEIQAASSGKVVKSGWVTGFGKTLVIDHGDGVETLYAHNSSLLVRVGEQVYAGQIIARAGSTGKSTGSHLHFAVLVNDKPVDPMQYLP